MAFMGPEIVFGHWYEVETTRGTEWLSEDVVGDIGLQKGHFYNDESENWDEIVRHVTDYIEGKPREVRLVQGYGARLSAPGYLDCTEWSVFRTEEEAEEYLHDVYGEEQ